MKSHQDPSKEQLKSELVVLRRRLAKLEATEVERKQVEEQLQKQTHDLGERIKELNCLYDMSGIAENHGVPLEKLLQEIVDLIPLSWQYPEAACARIILNSREVVTVNFRETAWKQTSDITAYGNRIGCVEVHYLEERPEYDEGPFLKEERNLINAIAERVGGITEQKQAEEELRVSEKWLSTTLRSIGDAVIATDAKGHVTLMNPVAQTLTGWNEEDAKEKPLKDVFNIISEETGKQEENLATRVIREGVVVGLANHTVLIAKDGTRRPVDHSGAPIRDDMGNTIGVILVFRDITERKWTEAQLSAYHKELRSLVSQLSLAEECERRRIAVALHDRIGQTLAICRVRLEALVEGALPGVFVQPLGEINTLLKQIIQETRSLTFEVSSPLLYELGLEAALGRLSMSFCFRRYASYWSISLSTHRRVTQGYVSSEMTTTYELSLKMTGLDSILPGSALAGRESRDLVFSVYKSECVIFADISSLTRNRTAELRLPFWHP